MLECRILTGGEAWPSLIGHIAIMLLLSATFVLVLPALSSVGSSDLIAVMNRSLRIHMKRKLNLIGMPF